MRSWTIVGTTRKVLRLPTRPGSVLTTLGLHADESAWRPSWCSGTHRRARKVHRVALFATSAGEVHSRLQGGGDRSVSGCRGKPTESPYAFPRPLTRTGSSPS